MESIEKIEENLKVMLSNKRYLHSVGTMKMARKLAKIYGINEEIAGMTGLVHDIGKELTESDKMKYIKENKIPIDEIEKENIGLLHAKIGADMAKKMYGFTEEMQEAIKYHTTASTNMTLLSKIIFIADKIEETRNYPDIETVRKLSTEDIDKCMLYILEYNIKKNVDEKKLIHPNTILARNEILLRIKNNK